MSFLSASFDRQMKLWDTETGQCKARFTTGKIPHVVKFNPSSPNDFLAGTSKFYCGKMVCPFEQLLACISKDWSNSKQA